MWHKRERERGFSEAGVFLFFSSIWRRCGEKAGDALAGETEVAAVPDLENGWRQRSSCVVRQGDSSGTRCCQSKKEGDRAGLEETTSGAAAAMAGAAAAPSWRTTANLKSI
ncbi:uncharacterized protein LOC131000402 [Salvia miltiorrhiza]|uniref:uncharacterized protein LOC131000402 n=1 Tax=Salvia miltiorrhiza TaxID=226208 RepID=UPI0025ABF4A8|nr:uncharacterized protein LOC131000402 [Salvia miltiorrhiza]